ncbi:MAG: fibrobacter succinogenes major paralogous domain-containing protein [Bacteroidales bacterium]|nr:fibrobacter succinogenes major paralogous domain-containing protein [Bacteroidales bacterium]
MNYKPVPLLETIFLASILLFLLVNCKKNETGPLAEVLTAEEVFLTQTKVISGGNIISDGGYPVTERGVCWSKKHKPTIKENRTNDGSGVGSYASEITGLSIGVNYYIRAYAMTEKGTAYGSEIVIMDQTGTKGSVVDIDGNTYKTIGIGTQIWMAENLKVSRYRTGDYLSYPGNDLWWRSITTGCYAWFDDDEAWQNVYGALYDWSAVSAAKGLCPEGWRIPDDVDWDKLVNYIGGDTTQVGILLKSCRQVGSSLGGECNTIEHPRWDENLSNSGTDQFEFGALPGGFRLFDGSFPNFLGSNGQWWTSEEGSNNAEAIAYGLSSSNNNLFRDKYNKKFGFSVRCVKDE